jgi:hypothetical protein
VPSLDNSEPSMAEFIDAEAAASIRLSSLFVMTDGAGKINGGKGEVCASLLINSAKVTHDESISKLSLNECSISSNSATCSANDGSKARWS